MTPREALDELAYLLREAIMLEQVPDFVAPLITDFLISGELQKSRVYDSPQQNMSRCEHRSVSPILADLVRQLWLLSPPNYSSAGTLVHDTYLSGFARDLPALRYRLEKKKQQQQQQHDAPIHEERAACD